MAPVFCASSMDMVSTRTGTFSIIAWFTRRSTSAISSAVIACGWEMSKRVSSAFCSEPFCSTCVPSTSRRALCIKWVTLWLRMMASRTALSTSAQMLSPTFRLPETSVPKCPCTAALIFCVSSTAKRFLPLKIKPTSPTCPPDSA